MNTLRFFALSLIVLTAHAATFALGYYFSGYRIYSAMFQNVATITEIHSDKK